MMPSTPAPVRESHFVLGETLTPLLTHAMGSSIELFETNGAPGGGPPPHTHPWEEIYFVLSGEMEVVIDGRVTLLGPSDHIHIPAGALHAYKTPGRTHFLTIVSKGNASKFFRQVATEVDMSPPDIAGVLRIGAEHGIRFLP